MTMRVKLHARGKIENKVGEEGRVEQKNIVVVDIFTTLSTWELLVHVWNYRKSSHSDPEFSTVMKSDPHEVFSESPPNKMANPNEILTPRTERGE
uniref:Uncharacterized protein n=1 Tax=Vitis vinifera TaxID=29760 RepID=A5AW62_VITVI|nr:hypothetical protein VITISV_016470 [Vitis vinifera]